MKCWLLLCSDLALRSSTAARIAPEHYSEKDRTITFETKFGTKQTLPVTRELQAIFATVGGEKPAQPYVAQLSRLGRITSRHLRIEFQRLRKEAGIARRIVPHDLRRTTAVRTLDVTGDLRTVQALLGHRELATTLYYLDHRNTPVELTTLELAKLQPVTERPQ